MLKGAKRKAAVAAAFTAVFAGGSYLGEDALVGNACGCNTPTIPAAPDSTPPTVSVTAPAAAAVVSGPSSTITATASDNIAVVGVQFKIDGSNLGAEDLVAPYTLNWNTTVYTDGAHTLTAVARDAAGNSTTSSSVAITVTNTGTVLNLYHEFVAPAGTTNCTRNTNLIDYASALSANNVCTTFSKAYAISTDGDTVGVEPASYAAQQIAYVVKTITGSCNYWPAAKDISGCITFEPDGGGAPLGAAVTLASFFTAAPYVRLKNMQTTGGVYVSWKNTSTGRPCSTLVPQPHDVVFDGIEFNGASSSFSDDSAYNVSLVNSRFDGNQDVAGGSNVAAFILNNSPSAQGDCTTAAYPSLTQTQLNPDQVYIHNNKWNGLKQTTNVGSPHEQCLHVRMANDYEISNNQFLNCAQYGLNLESQGTSSPTRNLDNGLIAGNVFDAVCSNQTAIPTGTCNPIQPLAIICHTTGDTITHLTVAYNTIHSGTSIWQQASGGGTPCNPGTTATFANDVFVGNASDSASQCVTGRGLSYAYNTWASGATCDATDQIAAAGFTNSAPTTWDFTPSAGSALIGFVPPSETVNSITVLCPSTDVYGFARPAGGQTKCAGGGAEPLVASNQTHGSGMASSLSEHSLSSPLIDTSGNSTGTNGTTYYYTYRCATCTSGANDGPYPLIIELTGSPSGSGASCSGQARTTGGLGYSQALARCIVGGSATSLTNTGQMMTSGWKNEADTAGAVIVAPVNAWTKCQGTNDPGCTASATNVNFHSFGGDYGNDGLNHGDGGYYTTTWFDSAKQVLDAVNGAESLANIDTTKIYLVGDSSGGNFAEQLYCNASTWTFQTAAPTVTAPFLTGATTFYQTPQAALVNTIDGLGLWSSALRATAKNTVPGGQGAYGCSSPQTTHSVPIIHVHGTLDTAVPYTGGTSLVRTGCANVTTGNSCFTSQAQEQAFWFTGGGGMGCSSTPSSGPTVTGSLTITVYGTGCAGGHAYRTDVVQNGAHDTSLFNVSTSGTPCTISTGGTTCSENIPLQIYTFLSTH